MLTGACRKGLLALAVLVSVGREEAAVVAQERPSGGGEWLAAYEATREQVKELRAEVDVMRRIRAAQEEVMAWNEERARLGLSAMTLRPAVCLEGENRRWCRLFPSTFGAGEGGP